MKKLRYVMALVGAGVFGVALLVAPSPAQAADTWWVIMGYQSGKCIDNPGYATHNAWMDIWTCVGPPRQSNEQWKFNKYGDAYTIQNRYSGKCLTVENKSRANNAHVIQYRCDTTATEYNGLWYQTKVTTRSGFDYYQFESVESLKCLTVQNASIANGAKLLQYECNGGGNQYWTWMG